MLYPVELRVQTLSAAPYARPVVCSILGLRLKSGSARRPDVCFVETIAVTVVPLTAIDPIECSPVPLSLFALAVLGVLFLVVSLFYESHNANILKCWGGGT